MSKSLGNVVDPLKIIQESGADILRMWVASTDYFEDVRIGKEILVRHVRRLSQAAQHLPLPARRARRLRPRPSASTPADMPELERYVLHLLATLDGELREAVERFRVHPLRHRADHLRQQRSVGLLLRYPQGQPLLRRGRRAQAPRLSHRARHPVPRAGPLRRADPLLHRRGSVGHALSRTAASVHLLEWPEIEPTGPTRELAESWTELRALRAAGQRRDRAEAPRQGARLQPRGQGDDRPRRPARPAAGQLGRSRRAVHRLRCRHRRGDAAMPSRSSTAPISTNAAAAGGICPK